MVPSPPSDDSHAAGAATPSLAPPPGSGSASASTQQSQSPVFGASSGDTASTAGTESREAQEDIQARIERKRLEHEQQRAVQRQAFEQQMQRLEQQQREEEASLLRRPGTDGTAAEPERRFNSAALGDVAASAPTTPPIGAAQAGRSAARRSLIGADDDRSARPEEGLNGSNVPGLPPPGGSSTRSVPASRRISAGPDELGSAARRQNAVLGDVAGAFERLSVGGRTGAAPGQVPQQLSQQSLQRAALARAAEGSAEGTGASVASTPSGFTPVFNERFLFDDELDAEDAAFVRRYNLQDDDDKFPVLIRHDSNPGMLSASSAALDLAPLSQTPPRFGRNIGAGARMSEWPQFSEHDGDKKDTGRQRSPQSQTQQSQSQSQSPPHASPHSVGDAAAGDRRGRSERSSPLLTGSQRAASLLPLGGGASSPSSGRASPGLGLPSSQPRAVSGGQPGNAGGRASAGSRFASGPHRLSQHFVADEDAADTQLGATGRSSASTSPQQSRGAPELSSSFGNGQGAETSRPTSGAFPSFAIDGFAAAPSGAGTPSRFGYAGNSGTFDGRSASNDASRPASGYFEAFGTSAGAGGGAGLYGKGPLGAQQGAAAANKFGMGLPPSDGMEMMKGRKGDLDVNTPLEELHGEIFALCKDQHGCRYLQKKLEEGVPAYRDMIFRETFAHFTELMTDPFGNYLCQKMLEFCTDEQRNVIVEAVAPELVSISLNMHGTRAVQKTIDFLSTTRQIHSIIVALSMSVVTLIKDLNGNHVIQKCLNRLGAEDNQFIYNAVAAHCVEVATHRHGCCVLQRCIDHASETQRTQLVTEITFNALTLVQDPFGNYVVQYILDLNDARYSDAVIRQFIGNVCLLSVQKFSSNVMEKCIRVSEPSVRKQLIEELLNRTRLEKLLRDSFANYVVQTSLDYADPLQRMQLVECIRPILPMIRNTPYGKRIQSKLQRDNLDMGGPPAHAGHAGGMPYSLMHAAHQQQLQAMAAMAGRPGGPAPPPPEFLGMNNMPYNAAAHGALHQQPGAHMMHPAHAGHLGAPLPPPHMARQHQGHAPPPPGAPYGPSPSLAAAQHARLGHLPPGGNFGPRGAGRPYHGAAPPPAGPPSQAAFGVDGPAYGAPYAGMQPHMTGISGAHGFVGHAHNSAYPY